MDPPNPRKGGVMPALRKYPDELRKRAIRLVMDLVEQPGGPSLNRAPMRVGSNSGSTGTPCAAHAHWAGQWNRASTNHLGRCGRLRARAPEEGDGSPRDRGGHGRSCTGQIGTQRATARQFPRPEAAGVARSRSPAEPTLCVLQGDHHSGLRVVDVVAVDHPVAAVVGLQLEWHRLHRPQQDGVLA